ncbi:MAG: methylated-DNA--[protein]-cysteine S-methyltransferase [Acidimicrobiia bacterium]|nr:methylated-DNA--[protein]-cysteine S-methyltransferase [Acidimicrobiia bacterium]
MVDTAVYESPLGRLRLAGEHGFLTGVYFEDHVNGPPISEDTRELPEAFHHVMAQLDEYFVGDRQVFDLPMRPVGSAFQLRVWAGLLEIEFGTTLSYGDLADRLGDRKASRAVGRANGKNPISIIVPCHRVVGADGSLTGYGGGLDRKLWLLRHEGALLV